MNNKHGIISAYDFNTWYQCVAHFILKSVIAFEKDETNFFAQRGTDLHGITNNIK